MAAIDRSYLTRHPFAVIVESASGHAMLFASFRERCVADRFASGLVAQGKRAFVRIDPRLHEVLDAEHADSRASACD